MLETEYVSPDGQLHLLVLAPEGDLTLGFSGFPWHTHGSILAALSGKTEVEAVRDFVKAVTENQRVIALMRQAGELRDIWISSSPEKDVEYRSSDEIIEFRLWNGTSIHPKQVLASKQA
ncbi:MAG: hypothetical protein WDN04_04190 [Rhodospirillales bacterium]